MSSVNGVGAATANYNYTATSAKKKGDPVKKGALISGGLSAATAGVGLYSVSKFAQQNGTTIGKCLESSGLSKGKYAAIMGIVILGNALIGAGIGKLVKNHQEKKAAKEAEAQAAGAIDYKA